MPRLLMMHQREKQLVPLAQKMLSFVPRQSSVQAIDRSIVRVSSTWASRDHREKAQEVFCPALSLEFQSVPNLGQGGLKVAPGQVWTAVHLQICMQKMKGNRL